MRIALQMILAVLTLSGPALAQAAHGDPQAMAARIMARADTDRNGTLSQAEWLAIGRKAKGFARMDTNHDGQVDKAELVAGVAAIQARHAAKADTAPAPASEPAPQ